MTRQPTLKSDEGPQKKRATTSARRKLEFEAHGNGANSSEAKEKEPTLKRAKTSSSEGAVCWNLPTSTSQPSSGTIGPSRNINALLRDQEIGQWRPTSYMDLPEPVCDRAKSFFAPPLVRLCLHLRSCSACYSGDVDFCPVARRLVSERNTQLRALFLAEMEHDDEAYYSDDSDAVSVAHTEIIVISDDE